MEDIYDDLNNYEDVNCVQELRNENIELKVKLEEHAAAMEKLQKQILQDYDKLEMEFKKLENNYSSLLKTARSEIERKSKRISQLNMEKDIMVLESLKKGKNIRRHFNKSVLSHEQVNKKVEEVTRLQNIDKRFRTTDVQTENYPNSGADNRISMVNKIDNVSAKPDTSYKSKSIIREKPTHHKTEYNDTLKTRAGSIKDRRKSMPVVSIEKFSSDEENEHINSIKETRTDKFERRNINKFPIDRYSNKTSETSSIDDRVSNYHESTSREIYRGRTNRHETNSYLSRDKHKVSQKYRNDYSPERGQKRQHSHSEHKDDYYRQEQGRYRPRDNPEHDRYQRRNLDHRANYDRHSYDHEKNRHYYEEKYGGKHKVSNDYDEPLTKRKKTEYFRNPDVHNRVEKDYYNDKESVDIQSSPELSPHQYDALRLSCQSPDYVYTDVTLAYPIKEIMATATTPLEDPRVTSKRYAITQDKGKETLSAVVGRNIDIKSVNKALWNIERVKIPDALVRPPSLPSYEIVKDIDVNIDSPVSNVSLESGQIHCESDNEGHETREKSKVVSHVIRDDKISRQVPERLSKQAMNAEEVSKLIVAKYRIPKIGQSNSSAQTKKDVPIIDVSESVPTTNHTKIVTEVDFSKKLLTRLQKDDHVNLLPSNKNGSKHDHKDGKNQVTLSKIAIVADDLELSDENSDNVDSNGQMIAEKVTKYCKVQPNITEKKDSTSNLKNHSDSIANTNKTKEPADTVKIKAVEVDDKAKSKEGSSDSFKKQKSKKKKPKSKEVSKDSIEGSNTIPVAEKKKRSKKEKECKPKEINTKFSDLFGDSSSLMTPEDLGIPSYLPISEDAQDAVDLKINQIIDASPIKDKAESAGGNEGQCSIEIKQPEAQQQPNTDKELTKNIKKEEASKRKEDIDTDEIAPSDIYENLNPGTDSNEPDIVKTIIISTGVQPQITLENNSEALELLEKPNADVEVHTKPIADCYSRQDILKALATSTPHKETILNPITEIRTNDLTKSDSSSSKTTESKAVHAVNQTNMNIPDSQDAPDVRIFVKRRRKIMKRPPMT